MSNGNILVVDDDVKIASMLNRTLAYEGYDVTFAHNGEDALIAFMEQPFDLVILDIMLPGLAGWDVCREIRSQSQIPILMLTAKDEIEDRVKGLDLGADDYVVKPFSLEELLARIRAHLRRNPAFKTNETTILTFGDIVLDLESRECRRDNQIIALKGKEVELLELFLLHPNKVLSKEQILTQIWGYDYEGESNVIEVYIASLRSKLEANGGKRVILTVRGLGYILKEAL
jgi:two-component system, OmpR family, response regulator MprA